MEDHEVPMSVSTYKRFAKDILPKLRLPSDPPPVANVLPGCATSREVPAEIRQVLQDCPGEFELVRGFKLVDLSEGAQNSFVWSGRGMLCLRTKSGKVVSVARATSGHQHTPFIFVPSSLLHQDLTDDELLSGVYQLGSVIGGDPTVSARLLLKGVTQCEFERNLFVENARELVPLRNPMLRPYPFFNDFCKMDAEIAGRLVDAAISFGMPYRCESGDEVPDEPNTAETLLFPRFPWRFDMDTWLPSTRRLHATLDYAVQTPMSVDEQRRMFMNVYVDLGHEYLSRFHKEVAAAVRRAVVKQQKR
jgi:hypothetical protein